MANDVLNVSEDDLYRTSMDLAFRQHLTDKVLNRDTLQNPDLPHCHLIIEFAIKGAFSRRIFM